MNTSRKLNTLLSILITILLILFVASPKENMEACINGLLVWATSVAPALFPFLIFTKLLSELKLIEKISKYLYPITSKLFHTSGISAYVYMMSVLSGYPVGAKLTADLYEHNVISKNEANRIVTFTSTSGPLFIIATVGIGMLHSEKVGIIILISHFVGALLNGLLYRNYKYNKSTTINIANYPTNNSENILEDIMVNSIKSILIIGGYVSIFFVIITMLNNFNILYPIKYILTYIFQFLHIPTSTITPILNGIIEVTRGCLDLSTISISPTLLTAIATFLISFGGLSIHMQSLTFIKKFDIKLSFYFFQKFTHAIISTMIAVFICLLT